jgi:hypothetical protein
MPQFMRASCDLSVSEGGHAVSHHPGLMYMGGMLMSFEGVFRSLP